MNRSLSMVVFGLMIVASGAPLVAQTDFHANLDESQVAPAGTGSAATGTATLLLNAAGDALSYSITLVGLDLDGNQTPLDPNDDVLALHFHGAPAGVNGPVVFGLISPNHDLDDLVIDPVAGTLSGVWEDTDPNPLAAQLANLNSGGLYLNVHTTANPGGEIRGQVLAGPAPLVGLPFLSVAGLLMLALMLGIAGGFLVFYLR